VSKLTPAVLRKRVAELEEEVRASNQKLEESRQENVKLVSYGRADRVGTCGVRGIAPRLCSRPIVLGDVLVIVSRGW
jgi:hypothetical protein